MPVAGRVFRINDETLALGPILVDLPIIGEPDPILGTSHWSGLTVDVTFSAAILPFVNVTMIRSATTASDGSFSVPSDVPPQFGNLPWQVSLIVTSGVPLYRSAPMPLAQATSKSLNIWLFPQILPTSSGVSAGTISGLLAGGNLPGTTTITSAPAAHPGTGLEIQFSEPGAFGIANQVHIDFGVTISPDKSSNLSNFLDIGITFANIGIDFPTSLFKSYNDIYQIIQSQVAQAGGSMNASVLAKLEQQVQQVKLPVGTVTAAMASDFVTEDVSVTFTDVSFPNQHTWLIGDVKDPTIVLAANPCIGYPRNLIGG